MQFEFGCWRWLKSAEKYNLRRQLVELKPPPSRTMPSIPRVSDLYETRMSSAQKQAKMFAADTRRAIPNMQAVHDEIKANPPMFLMIVRVWAL